MRLLRSKLFSRLKRFYTIFLSTEKWLMSKVQLEVKMLGDNIPTSKMDRLNFIIDLSWKVFFEKVASGCIKINKESSMQLHYSSILNTIGELFCILPGETFSLELESSYGRKNLDITCRFDDVSAAIELKCFRKSSNRPLDLDMYDVWVDLTRLHGLDDFHVKRFICLTDYDKYAYGNHRGYAATFSIAHGAEYKSGVILTPEWLGKWKDKSRDHTITVPKDITFNWVEKDGWYYLLLDV